MSSNPENAPEYVMVKARNLEKYWKTTGKLLEK